MTSPITAAIEAMERVGNELEVLSYAHEEENARKLHAAQAGRLKIAKTALQALKASVPDGLEDDLSRLANAMAEKYPLGTDFGRYEKEIRAIYNAAEILLNATKETT